MKNDPEFSFRDLTVWDVVIEVLKGKEEVYLITLKADLPVLKKVAEGFSAHSIGLMLGVSTGSIINSATTWGMFPVETTLDFSPMYVYETGMSVEELLVNINTILPVAITENMGKMIIHNIERYYELLSILNEEERKEEND